MNHDEWRELERAGFAHPPAAYRRQDLFELWTSLKGRITRSDYWLRYVLPFTGLNIGAMVVDLTLGTITATGFGLFGVALSLVSVWPGIAVSVKRLHDLGYPGWYVPALYGAVFGAGVTGAIFIPLFGAPAALVFVPLLLVSLYAMWIGIKVSFFRGTYGSNEYGPDPLGGIDF